MKNQVHNKKLLSRLAGLTYILMLVATFLFQIMDVGKQTIQDILFQTDHILLPPWWNYWIWIFILILLGGFNLYQISFNRRRPDNNDRVVRRVNTFSICINLSYIIWVILGAYFNLFQAHFALVFLVIGLYLARRTISNRSTLSRSEVRSILIPFSFFYGFGLIVFVQQIYGVLIEANILGGQDPYTTYAPLVIGGLLLISVLGFKDIWIGIVGLWTFAGFFVKYVLNAEVSNHLYNYLLIGNVIILIIAIILVQFQQQKKKHRRRR